MMNFLFSMHNEWPSECLSTRLKAKRRWKVKSDKNVNSLRFGRIFIHFIKPMRHEWFCVISTGSTLAPDLHEKNIQSNMHYLIYLFTSSPSHVC